MPQTFPERDDIFGREADIQYLLERCQRPGVTFLFGRSQMGKSTLVKEVARRLSAPNPLASPTSLTARPPALVGYFQSLGQEDLFLRTVADLYTRWLSGSTYFGQAKAVLDRQKKDTVGRFGEAFGSLFEQLSKAAGKPLETAGGLVRQSLQTLAQTNRDLLTGGLQLSPLSIEQGRDLLRLLHSITHQPATLVFDQWEQSSRIRDEANLLRTFLRDLPEWPPCHILLTSLPDEKPRAAADALSDAFPEAALIELPPLDLEAAATRKDLLAHLRDKVSLTRDLADDDLLELIAGHPEVIHRWTTGTAVGSVADLRERADNAHNERYKELLCLPNLSTPERLLLIRLALLPGASAPDMWASLKRIVLSDIPVSAQDALGSRWHLLEDAPLPAPPSLGHRVRYAAAFRRLRSRHAAELSAECESLVFALASNLQDTTASLGPFAESLASLSPVVSELNLSPVVRTLCRAAKSIVGEDVMELGEYRSALTSTQDLQQSSSLLATGLFNTLQNALFAELDFDLAGTVLDELRSLRNRYPDSSATRKALVKGLSRTLRLAALDGGLAHRDALLDELRSFDARYPDDPAVREQLAMGLVSTRQEARNEDDLRVAMPCFRSSVPSRSAARTTPASVSGLLKRSQMRCTTPSGNRLSHAATLRSTSFVLSTTTTRTIPPCASSWRSECAVPSATPSMEGISHAATHSWTNSSPSTPGTPTTLP